MSSTRIKPNGENTMSNETSGKVNERGRNKGSSTTNRKPLGNYNSQAQSNSVFGQKAVGFDKIKKDKDCKIYEDSDKTQSSTSSSTSRPSCKSLKTCQTQTKLTGNDLIDFQATVQPDLQFYKELVEKKSEALNESLKENEELWVENEERKEKINYLEEKVASLEETVEKARKITELIEPYLNEETEDGRELVQDKNNTQNSTSVDSEQTEIPIADSKCSDEAECLEAHEEQQETEAKLKNDDDNSDE